MKDQSELRPNVDGVPESGAIGAGRQEAADAVAASAGIAEPQAGAIAEQKVKLEELPDFRAYQSRNDSEKARLTQDAAQERQAREALQQRLEELEDRISQTELEGIEPEEQVERLKGQLMQLRQKIADDERQHALSQRAANALTTLGLNLNAPEVQELFAKHPPTIEGFADLMEDAAKLVAVAATGHSQQAQEAAARAVREAEARVLQETGVASATLAKGGAAPSLVEEFERRAKALRGSGRTADYLALRKEYRKKGLDI